MRSRFNNLCPALNWSSSLQGLDPPIPRKPSKSLREALVSTQALWWGSSIIAERSSGRNGGGSWCRFETWSLPRHSPMAGGSPSSDDHLEASHDGVCFIDIVVGTDRARQSPTR